MSETEKQEKSGKAIPHPTRWKKGVSGNPAGRPRKAIITTAAKELLEEPFPMDLVPENNPLSGQLRKMVEEGATYGKILAFTQIVAGIGGDTAAFNAIANRTEGMPRQKIELDATVKEEYDYSHIPDSDLENIIRLQDENRATDDDNGTPTQAG